MKTTPDRPNLFAVNLRVRGKEQDVKAFLHLLQQMEEKELVSLEKTPQFYERQEQGKRGKPMLPKKTNKPWGDAYCEIQFTYPDYPELEEE